MTPEIIKFNDGVVQALESNQTKAFISAYDKPGTPSLYNRATKWYGQPTKAKVNGAFYHMWDAHTRDGKPFKLLLNGRKIIVQPL